MQEIKGNLWGFHKRGDPIVITTNGTIKTNGEAVMGRGIAAQAAAKFPNIPSSLGYKLTKQGNIVHVFNVAYPTVRLFTFPVKHNWWEPADINLIQQSAMQLRAMADLLDLRNVYMPRPGCGNGQLKWEDVKPYIEGMLDHRFTVVEIKSGQ